VARKLLKQQRFSALLIAAIGCHEKSVCELRKSELEVKFPLFVNRRERQRQQQQSPTLEPSQMENHPLSLRRRRLRMQQSEMEKKSIKCHSTRTLVHIITVHAIFVLSAREIQINELVHGTQKFN
jgi:hypothetical protein